MHYVIDLDVSRPRIKEYDLKTIEEDLEYFGLKKLSELQDPDWRIFATSGAAEAWLERFESLKNSLSNASICQSRKLPGLLYKRRHMILALTGEKLETTRRYNKAWKPGQLFNLYDQTFFLTVRLKKIVRVDEKNFRYSFELP